MLHILDHSVPKTDGYSIRSANIMRYQREFDIEPVALTSPAHPENSNDIETIDGIRHYRTNGSGLPSAPFVHQYLAVRRMSSRIDEVVKSEQPAILHAHSPSLWGLAASRVAKRRGLPFVYEVRGFWEDAAVDQGLTSSRSIRYRLSRTMELYVARAADAVVVIAEHLKKDLVLRGVADEKFSVVKNGVDRNKFVPCERDRKLESKLGLAGRPTIGYVGTLYPWEGVDDLVRAVPLIRQRVPDIRVLIVGAGLLYESLGSLVKQLDVADCVDLLGSVSHSDIAEYYSVMDILVYPRKRSRNTETVTPLKPLEAMAMDKPVIGSDVGGIQELIPLGTGVLFRAGESTDLAEKCVDLITDPEHAVCLPGTPGVRSLHPRLESHRQVIYRHLCRRRWPTARKSSPLADQARG